MSDWIMAALLHCLWLGLLPLHNLRKIRVSSGNPFCPSFLVRLFFSHACLKRLTNQTKLTVARILLPDISLDCIHFFLLFWVITTTRVRLSPLIFSKAASYVSSSIKIHLCVDDKTTMVCLSTEKWDSVNCYALHRQRTKMSRPDCIRGQ